MASLGRLFFKVSQIYDALYLQQMHLNGDPDEGEGGHEEIHRDF